jgi:hypothetical protein
MRNKEKLYAALDVIKGLLQWAVVTVLAFGYWMFVLLLLSLFLMNIWITSFEKLLRYGTVLTVITSVVYAGILLRRKFH